MSDTSSRFGPIESALAHTWGLWLAVSTVWSFAALGVARLQGHSLTSLGQNPAYLDWAMLSLLGSIAAAGVAAGGVVLYIAALFLYELASETLAAWKAVFAEERESE